MIFFFSFRSTSIVCHGIFYTHKIAKITFTSPISPSSLGSACYSDDEKCEVQLVVSITSNLQCHSKGNNHNEDMNVGIFWCESWCYVGTGLRVWVTIWIIDTEIMSVISFDIILLLNYWHRNHHWQANSLRTHISVHFCLSSLEISSQ